MRLVSTDLTVEELRSLAESIADSLDLKLENVENRTEKRVPTRGKFKGMVKHNLHFLLRPKDGSDRFRSCQNRGSYDEPKRCRTAYVCWIGYLVFGRSILHWWREEENKDKHIEMYAGGKRYNTRGKLVEYIENGWSEYYGSNRKPSTIAPFNKFQGQQESCMCAHGMIKGQSSRCDEI